MLLRKGILRCWRNQRSIYCCICLQHREVNIVICLIIEFDPNAYAPQMWNIQWVNKGSEHLLEQSPSQDIATGFATLDILHLVDTLEQTDKSIFLLCTCRCGDGLCELFRLPWVQQFLCCGPPSVDSKPDKSGEFSKNYNGHVIVLMHGTQGRIYHVTKYLPPPSSPAMDPSIQATYIHLY